jgi:hypothetical protein
MAGCGDGGAADDAATGGDGDVADAAGAGGDCGAGAGLDAGALATAEGFTAAFGGGAAGGDPVMSPVAMEAIMLVKAAPSSKGAATIGTTKPTTQIPIARPMRA